MQHNLTLRGPVVSLEPLTLDHAEAWLSLGDAEAYAFHTSTPRHRRSLPGRPRRASCSSTAAR